MHSQHIQERERATPTQVCGLLPMLLRTQAELACAYDAIPLAYCLNTDEKSPDKADLIIRTAGIKRLHAVM